MRMYLVSGLEGFGYDAKSKDFKVVRVVRPYLIEDYDFYIPPRVEIYDLSKR